MAGAELPPRSAASLRLTRPPALSLGFGSGSDGSLRLPASLMSVEEEPAAEGLETGRRDSAPRLGKGRGGGEKQGEPLAQVRSSSELFQSSASGRTSMSQKGHLRPRRMKDSKSVVGPRQRQIRT